METESHLLRLLADGDRHSGTTLAAQLGISRAAVSKAIQRTRQRFDIDIPGIKGHGYQLRAPLDLLDATAIADQLPADAFARVGSVLCFDQIDSTNGWLHEHATQGANSGTCVLAESQTAGRGRRGRTWYSPFGANLYLSIAWRFDSGPAALATLSLAAGAAVAQALQSLGVEGLQLKWPNDIHWQGRKLGGLLIEVAGETQGPTRAVIGLGLNLHMPAAATAAIDQPWVDLNHICRGQTPKRNRIAACCIDQLSIMLASYLDLGPAPFLDVWRRFDGYRDRPVTLHWGNQSLHGIYRGISEQGALRLETDDQIRCFTAGEVSLRPDTDTEKGANTDASSHAH